MQSKGFFRIFILSGAYVAYVAGSGFGSGQEVMQYGTSFGYMGALGIIMSALMWVPCAAFIVSDARNFGLTSLREVYLFYCGPYIGNGLFFFALAYLFCMASLMIAGAGAAFAQYFNVGNEVGRIIMTTMVLITGLFGLRKTVDVIGSLGPCIIIFVVIIAIVALANGATGLDAGNEYVKSHDLLKPTQNWLWAAVMSASYGILFQAAYLSGVATTSQDSTRQLTISVLIGGTVYVLASLLMMLAFLSNISVLDGIEVPNLYLGGKINPFLGAIYGLILVAALYTTTAPLVWSVTNVFAQEKTKAYPWVIVAVSVLAYFGSGFSSFSVMVNLVTTTAAYVGILYIVPVFYRQFVKRRKPPEGQTKA